MRVEPSRISFNRLAVIWFSALTVVTIAALCAWFVVTVRAGSRPMAGDWVGICQDGKPFLLLKLTPATNGYTGSISLGNAKITSPPSATNGSCTVNDPASPEHAMKIARAWMAGETLTLDSDRGQEYEMRLTGNDTAKLRFIATNRDESWFALRRAGR